MSERKAVLAMSIFILTMLWLVVYGAKAEIQSRMETESRITALEEEVKHLSSVQTEYIYLINREYNPEAPRFNPENVLEPSNVTPNQLYQVLAGTGLEGLSYAYVMAEHETGVNALLLVSITALESGWGTSNLAIQKNNISGFSAYDDSPYDDAMYFESKSECVFQTAMLLRTKYVDYGKDSVQEVGEIYASDPNWADKVIGIVEYSLSRMN